MDDTPAVANTVTPPPWKSPAATPESRRPAPTPVYDGVPRTGKSLYRWACDGKRLPAVNAIGKTHSFPRLVSDWDPEMVATAYAELDTTVQINNGRHPERSRS
jgi:hypothetical protein